MSYLILKGKFHVKGFSPDGDSIRFEANNPDLWEQFNWKTKKNQDKKKKQLRFEAIDALETHYEESHQPRSFGVAALEVLLEMIGIKDVVYNLAMTKIIEASDGTEGFIASPGLDVYERPICMVFPSTANLPDGGNLSVNDLPLYESINMQLLKLGLVYPTFYSSMPNQLLEKFSTETVSARNGKIGVWALDRTNDFTLWNMETIQNDVVILPKIFRRLTSFSLARSHYDELNDYLKKTRDKVLIRSTSEKKKLYEIMKIDGRRIKFLYNPEELIFDPKG